MKLYLKTGARRKQYRRNMRFDCGRQAGKNEREQNGSSIESILERASWHGYLPNCSKSVIVWDCVLKGKVISKSSCAHFHCFCTTLPSSRIPSSYFNICGLNIIKFLCIHTFYLMVTSTNSLVQPSRGKASPLMKEKFKEKEFFLCKSDSIQSTLKRAIKS